MDLEEGRLPLPGGIRIREADEQFIEGNNHKEEIIIIKIEIYNLYC